VNNQSYLNELLNSNLHVSFNPTCNKCTDANLLFDNFLIEFTDFVKKHTNSNIPVNNIKSHIYSNNNKNKLSYNLQCNFPSISLSSKFNLKIMYQNVRGLRTKLHDVISNFPILNYDIFILTETWLSSDIVDAELGLTGFIVFRADRNVYTSSCTRGGGVLIAVRQTLCPSLLCCAVQSVEQLFIKLSLSKKCLLLIGGVYIPPSAPIELYTAHAETVDELWQSSGCNMGIICGDFNLPNVNWHNSVSGLSLSGTVNDNVKAIGDIYRFLDFSQNNSIRNHIGSLLDLVFTSEIDIVVDTSPDSLVTPDKYHPPLSITYSMPDVPPQLDDQHSFRNFNCADYNSITNNMSSINWESEFNNLGTEAAASRLQTILITLIEQYVPLHIFRRSTFPKWVTLKLKRLIISKKIAHKKLKQFGTMHYRHRFSLLRAQVKLESRLAYESYLGKINTSLQNDPHTFWSFINNRRNTSGIPNVMHYGDIIASDIDIANLFALLFNSVYKSPLPPPHWNTENIGIKPFTFLPSRLTIELNEVEENLLSLRTTKSRGPDGISAQFLFNIRAQLKYPLLYLFNLSLAEGIFPSIWKTSQVTPIYKSGDPGSVSNYRPISGLPLIGKLFEKIVHKCIERKFKLVLSTNQHGFYGGRSTTTSALEFSAFIRDSFKNMSQVDVIFTDISKAFDSINHIVLIDILDKLGVGEPLLSWFKSYITGRRQFVSLFNQKSAEYLVTSGVPQGGHLSPLLFNILINTLCESVDIKMLLFADDVKLFNCVQSESDAISLQESLNKLVNWCNTVGLELAIHKCKVMSFSRRHSIIHYDYSIDNVILQRINQVEDLGFIFTPTLSFAPHIDWIVGKALRSLGFIRRHAGSVMSVRCLLILYTSLVRSIVEYGSVVWSPRTKCDIVRIERVQHRFLNMVSRSMGINHEPHDYKPVLIALNLSTLSERRNMSDIKLLNGLVSGVIDSPDLLSRIGFRIPSTTRSRDPYYLAAVSKNYLDDDPLRRAMSLVNNHTS